MFSSAISFVGIRPRASWAADFQTAQQVPDGLTPDTAAEALQASLEAWTRACAGLAADAGYQAAERYCIRQAFLGKIHAAFEAQGLGEAVAPVICEHALDVLSETPKAAQPEAQDFLDATDDQTTALLTHLQAVGAYYAQTAAPETLDGLESFVAEAPPPLPPTSAGFLCTYVLKADADIETARRVWQQFVAQNTAVRLVTLGADATSSEAAHTADPIFFSPGGAQKPGRCLWAQPSVLLPDVHRWLQEQGFAQPETAKCIFLRADGRLSGVLTTTDLIDDFAISDGFFNAS